MKWNSSVKQTENGEIPFHYTQLSQLRNELTPEPLSELELSNKVKMITVTREYDAGIITLFHAAGDFNYRSRWQEGVKRVEEVNHFLPRVGMKCRCIHEDGQTTIYSSSYSYTPEKISFSETDEDKKNSRYFILEKTADNKTKLTLEYYLEKNRIKQFLFNLGKKKKMEVSFERSLRNIDEVVKEINLPTVEGC